MKKLVSLALCAVLLAAACFSASAAAGVEIITGGVTKHFTQGDIISYSASLTADELPRGIEGTLSIDFDGVELTSVTGGEKLDELFTLATMGLYNVSYSVNRDSSINFIYSLRSDADLSLIDYELPTTEEPVYTGKSKEYYDATESLRTLLHRIISDKDSGAYLGEIVDDVLEERSYIGGKNGVNAEIISAFRVRNVIPDSVTGAEKAALLKQVDEALDDVFFALSGEERPAPVEVKPVTLPLLSFEAIIVADEGSYPITFGISGAFGLEGEEIGDFTLTPEMKAIRENTTVFSGDANNDGKVDIVDVTIIQRYLAQLIDEGEINLRNADVTDGGDGKVDIVDATYIQRYLAQITNLDGTPYTG